MSKDILQMDDYIHVARFVQEAVKKDGPTLPSEFLVYDHSVFAVTFTREWSPGSVL